MALLTYYALANRLLGEQDNHCFTDFNHLLKGLGRGIRAGGLDLQ